MTHAEKQANTIRWFKEKTQNKELDFKTMIQLFDILMRNLEVMSISQFANCKGLSYNGVLSKIQTGSLNALTFHGDTFVFELQKSEPVEIYS